MGAANYPSSDDASSPLVVVRPIETGDLSSMVGVVGRADGRGCWCQRFTAKTSEHKRQAFESEVHRPGEPIGLIAHVDGKCVGFSRVVRRGTLPGITGNRALARLLANDSINIDSAWWISCFAVTQSARGHGVGVSLLRAAAIHARTYGGAVLDGHPVDVAGLTGRPSPAALFTGTLSMFVSAGFHEIGRTYPTRPVMRTDLHSMGEATTTNR